MSRRLLRMALAFYGIQKHYAFCYPYVSVLVSELPRKDAQDLYFVFAKTGDQCKASTRPFFEGNKAWSPHQSPNGCLEFLPSLSLLELISTKTSS